MTKKILAVVFGTISLLAAGFASGAKEVVNWYEIARPYIIVCIVSFIIALVLYNWEALRRIIYPAIFCMMAWMYEHKLTKSKFGRHTYKVYAYFGKSYKTFYQEVQGAFDLYTKDTSEASSEG